MPETFFEGHETFFEGPGVAQDTHIVVLFLDRRFDSFFAVEDSLQFGHKIVPGLHDVAGLTLEVVADVDRPPDDVFEGRE